MAHMDIFNQRPFQMVELTAAVNKAPYRPQLLGEMGLFAPKRVRTLSVSIEAKEGVLSLIQTSPRGAPIEERENEKRTLRNFNTLRIARGQTLTADEIAGVRAFGSDSELQMMQNEIASIMDGETGLRAAVELTHENMRLSAVQGILTDANGATLFNWFTEMGVSQAAEIDFDLDNANPTSGALMKVCDQVVHQMRKAAKGAWYSSSIVVGLCGTAFWRDLIAHVEVRDIYKNMVSGGMRDGLDGLLGRLTRIEYGGVVFVKYWGTDDDSSVAIGTDKCKFFPANSPGVFEVAYSPAEFLPFVNTPGQDVYAIIVRDMQRDAWVRPEIYSYPLHYCTRPEMLQRAKRT